MSPLTLWVQILHRRGVLNTTLCDKDCQWLATGRWFSSTRGTPPLERYWVMGLEINSFLASTMHIPFPKSSQGIFYALEPWRFPSRAHTKWFVDLVHLWWLTQVLLISVISWRSVLVVVETRENHRPAASHWQTLSQMLYWVHIIMSEMQAQC